MNSNNDITIPFQVDLTNCDREPIHIPGSIQPHGILLALKEPDLTILQISNNIFNFLGLTPEELLNQPLNKLLECDQINFLQDCLSQEDLSFVNPMDLTIKSGNKAIHFDGIIHR